MTTIDLRRRIVQKIEKLPAKELKIINGYIESLEGDEEAAKELLAIHGFRKRLKQAEKEISDGKVYDFDKIRRDV